MDVAFIKAQLTNSKYATLINLNNNVLFNQYFYNLSYSSALSPGVKTI